MQTNNMLYNNAKLGDLADMVGVELRIAQILADRIFSDVQQSNMASGHYTVLSLIDMNPGINQSSLAKCMYLDRSSMVPILDQFEQRGWLERRKKPNDRRAYALHLTREGKAILKQADANVRRLEGRIQQGMGKEKRNKLLRLTKELQSTLHTMINDQ